MISSPLKTTLIALATGALGAGCAGDAAVDSAEAESTGGGEAEASCGGGEASCGGESAESPEAGASDPDSTTGTEAEASCGEGSCG